jgi:hypothetical protein
MGRTPQALAQDAFAAQVGALAQSAAQVDGTWAQFRSACGATVTQRYEGAREWFGMWDDQVRADLTEPACRDLFNKVVTLGQGVLRGMAAAEDAARTNGISPGDVRKILRSSSMDWGGWDRPAPTQLKP